MEIRSFPNFPVSTPIQREFAKTRDSRKARKSYFFFFLAAGFFLAAAFLAGAFFLATTIHLLYNVEGSKNYTNENQDNLVSSRSCNADEP
jgi:hypothetical protein